MLSDAAIKNRSKVSKEESQGVQNSGRKNMEKANIFCLLYRWNFDLR